MIYLDYVSATPMDSKVFAAMKPYFSNIFYNPSAAYGAAREAKADFEEARHKIAQTIGAKPAEIIMTAGATESINLAFNIITVDSQKTNNVSDRIITTSIEHPAVLEVAKARGATILPVDKNGRINVDELQTKITDETELVSIGYANNEIGTVQPIKEVAKNITEIRLDRLERGIKTPLLFHTDASQAAGLLDINVARLGIDLMTLNAGKCYGPKQVGLLYARAGIGLKPLIFGGGQEYGLRSGTENVAGAIGFAKALEITEKKRKSETKRLAYLRDDIEKFIRKEFSSALINGNKKYSLSNLINISFPGLDGERLLFALDQCGVQVATGSACAANKGTRSHVLTAIGLSDDQADGSIRISMGRDTTVFEIGEFKHALIGVVESEKNLV